MEFYQDDDWLEEEPEEVYDDEIEYLYGDDEADASDQILLDQNSLRRMDSEWKPSEAENDAAVDEAVDPILPFIGDVRENAHDPVAPISTATLLEQLDEVSVERRTQVARTVAEFDELIKEMDHIVDINIRTGSKGIAHIAGDDTVFQRHGVLALNDQCLGIVGSQGGIPNGNHSCGIFRG